MFRFVRSIALLLLCLSLSLAIQCDCYCRYKQINRLYPWVILLSWRRQWSIHRVILFRLIDHPVHNVRLITVKLIVHPVWLVCVYSDREVFPVVNTTSFQKSWKPRSLYHRRLYFVSFPLHLEFLLVQYNQTNNESRPASSINILLMTEIIFWLLDIRALQLVETQRERMKFDRSDCNFHRQQTWHFSLR